MNPIGARSCYDEAKRCGESFVAAYRLEHGMDARIARLFNTYGPRMRADDVYGRVVPRFIEQALTNAPITVFGDGSQTRSFCYVTDQIEGLLRFAFSEGLDGKTVNIGNDEEISIMALAETIKKLTSSTSEIKFEPLPKDDPLRRRPDIGKARDLLHWKPKVGLEEGLERTIQWFRMKIIVPSQYDVAVAYRIYPKVSRAPPVFADDKYQLSELCLKSFRDSLGSLKVKMFVLLDNCPPSYEDLFTEIL